MFKVPDAPSFETSDRASGAETEHPPPLSALVLDPTSLRERNSRSRLSYSIPVWIIVCVFNLSMIAFAVYVVAHPRTAPQSPDPATADAEQSRRLASRERAPAVAPRPIAPGSEADASWIGKRVVPIIPDLKLQTGGEIVSAGHRFFYRVEHVNGPSVEVTAEEDGIRGWVKSSEVIPAQKGVEFFTAQLRANPNDAFALAMRAMLRSDLRDMDAALEDLNAAIGFDRTHAWIFARRGVIWTDRREFGRAIADFTEAIRIDPGSASPYCSRGLAWNGAGEYGKALGDYNQAIQIEPQNALAYFNRAQLYAECPDVSYRDAHAAIESATSACELTQWKTPTYIETLALACALAGQYSLAAQNQSKAIALLTDERAMRDYRSRLKVYEQADRSAGAADPGSPASHNQDALVLFLTGHNEAVYEMSSASGPRGSVGDHDACYAELLGHFAARRAGISDRAKMLLDKAASRCEPPAWPFPLVQYLRGQIDERALLAATASDANGKSTKAYTQNSRATQAHCYVGLDLLQQGRQDLALRHFRWIKEHGDARVHEYAIALSELERIESK
jgi:tetratricopeptide (TPR) repeat protein